MPARRYAEGTSVTVESSRGEITGILAKHGVQRMGWMGSPDGDQLVFELEGGSYRLDIRRPTLQEVRQLYSHLYARQVDWEAKVQAEWRRRWRANVLLLKAKLEFIDSGDTTLERELLPYLVLKSGKTVEQTILDDGLPALTAGASKG